MPRVVLIPVGRNNDSEKVFDYYDQHIRKDGDKIWLFHSNDLETPLLYSYDGCGGCALAWEKLKENQMRRTKHLKEKYEEKCRHAGIKDATFVVAGGNTEESIVAMAKEKGADIIVMGAHKNGAIARTILGSIIDYVVHNSNTPTVIVPH